MRVIIILTLGMMLGLPCVLPFILDRLEWWRTLGPARQVAAVAGGAALAIPAGGSLLAKAEGGHFWASAQTMLATVAVMFALAAIAYALLGSKIAGTERPHQVMPLSPVRVGRNAPSGYERACLLELRIARLMSWLLALALPVEVVLGITRWTSALANWQKLVVLFLTLLSGAVSGTCEAAAEKQLREIWTTELSSSPR